MNLDKVRQLAQGYPQQSANQKARVESQVNEILARLETEPKPFAWRPSDGLGERVKWYKDVDGI